MKVIPLSQHKRHAGGIGLGGMRIFQSKRKSLFSWRRPAVDKRVVWWVAFGCAVYGLLTLFNLVVIPPLAGYSFWVVLGGLILLLVASR